MEIDPISQSPAGGNYRWVRSVPLRVPVPPQRAAAAPATPSYEDTVVLSVGVLKEAPRLPDVLKVRVESRKDGGQVVTLYDPHTGEVIAQMPPEQVIRAIDEVLRSHREGRRS